MGADGGVAVNWTTYLYMYVYMFDHYPPPPEKGILHGTCFQCIPAGIRLKLGRFH